jgi:sec-independent protein translocase protein TatB
MFGLTFEKLLLIGVIAVFLLGPERLPGYAAKLAQLVRTVRDMANGAKDRMRDEMGPDFDDVDWKKLDPRQYDPRRIIREALLDDGSAGAAAAEAPAVRPATRTRPEPAYLQHKAKSAGGPVPLADPDADGPRDAAPQTGQGLSGAGSSSSGAADAAPATGGAGAGVVGISSGAAAAGPVSESVTAFDSEAT